MTLFKRGWLVLVLCAFVAIPAFAQINKGIIEVVTIDEQEGALPGVTVTVARPETGFHVVNVTGADGVVRFAALEPGNYEFTTELAGFATTTHKNLGLRVGQTQRLTVILRPATSEAITVTAESEVVDVYKSDTSTNILPEQVAMLPTADRDFQKLAFIAPGVQRERGAFRFVTNGPVIGSAGNASQATIMVDGVNFTDPALGLARARFSQDAIQEFRVVNNRFDAEIGGSAGGALSIVTKSGTNDIRGSVFGFYRGAELREKGELEISDNDDYERTQLGFTVGGPFQRDRAHYFLSLEQIDEQNIVPFRPAGAFVSQAADIDHPFDQLLTYGGIDFNINDRQHLAAKIVYENYEEENFRVGGVADESYGQTLKRDNQNFGLEHSWILSSASLNEARFQFGSRTFDEPANSNTVAEWFSSGNTLQTGGNILGDLLGEGDYFEFRDTFHFSLASQHEVKAGVAWTGIEERSRIDTFQTGLFIYVTDTRALPLAYAYGTGSSDVTTDTDIYSFFIEDAWRPNSNFTLTLGVRYDLDTNGNNADIESDLGIDHPLIGERDSDDDNYQPRLSFTWDTTGRGNMVMRGGAGIFTGHFLLVPALVELQQNGITGRVARQRINGVILGLPQFALDPNNPTTTGIPLAPDIGLMQDNLEAPESTQASLGLTTRLGSTNLYLDTDAVYVEGDNEITIRDVNWSGNNCTTAVNCRPNTAYNQINMYTNDGRSEYTAFVVALNGTIGGGHLVNGSVTWSDKKNISDDFSPEFPTGYPNDPSDMDAEWGQGRSHEELRVILSGVFRLPWTMTIAPIIEYGSGQPFTQRLGYDWNGDGKNSDRPVGVERFTEEGPDYNNFSLRLTKRFGIGAYGGLDVILEGFNLLDETNYDVSSIDNARYLSGPTRLNPAAAYVTNPNYGRFRATLPPREFQLGVRWAF